MGRNAKGRADREVAKRIALDLPDVELASHHGTLDIRVRNRIFATFPADGKIVLLHSSPDEIAMMVAGKPDVFARTPRKGWVQVSLDDVDRETLQRLMIDAWLIAAPAALRAMYADRLKRD